MLKLYKEIEKILQKKSVETLQRNWENSKIKSVETLQKVEKILRSKVLKLYNEIKEKISDQKGWNFQNIEPNLTSKNVWLNFLLIKLTNQKSKSVLTWQFLFELYLNLTQKG